MNTRRRLLEALDAVVIHSPLRFSWCGRPNASPASALRAAITPEVARDYLVYSLLERLYTNFYCRGRVVAEIASSADLTRRRTPLARALSEANRGQGVWKPGWEVRGVEGEVLVVQREGLELRVPAQYCTARTDVAPVAGEQVRVRMPKEYTGMSPGYYMALGDVALGPEAKHGLLRIYWNIAAEGAVALMAGLSGGLNDAGLAFQFKVLNEAHRFSRCDTAVLYVLRRDYDTVLAVLEGVYKQVAGGLRPEIPVFTKGLAPGLGAAEDPGEGESFGWHRCHLLAEAMVRAYEQGRANRGGRLDVVEHHLEEEGISLTQPYLNPESEDVYAILAPTKARRGSGHAELAGSVPRVETSVGTEALLHTAEAIAQHIVRSAIRSRKRCTWVGAEPASELAEDGEERSVYSTLGPCVYDGTSGVALFLAEMYRVSAGNELRDSALGAMAQALALADRCPPPHRLGLYSGWLGIALAAARVGLALEYPDLLTTAGQLVRSAAKEVRAAPEFDLIAGLAGGITALVSLDVLLDDGFCLDLAVELGEGLFASAECGPEGCSWRHPVDPETRNLTGLSHGSAGVAHALLELYAATGEGRYRDLALRAFDYERHCFDAEVGNWPDFRDQPQARRRDRGPRGFMATWCHGAAGIALTRLAAYDRIADEVCKAEAETALLATERVTRDWLRSGNTNFSLCHGLAGNAEVLRVGAQVLGTPPVETVHAVARLGMESYARRGHPWPCGGKTGITPNLMLGLAGIGYFYLRVAKPTVPSVLLPTRG